MGILAVFDSWHPMLAPLERGTVAHTIEDTMVYDGENADLGEP